MLRRFTQFSVAFALVIAIGEYAAHWPGRSPFVPSPVLASTEYGRSFQNTGASAQKILTIVAANSYTGGAQALELTVCNPAAANLYEGKSDVSASNGFRLLPGECYTWRATSATDFVDISQMYVFTAADQTVQFTIRGK